MRTMGMVVCLLVYFSSGAFAQEDDTPPKPPQRAPDARLHDTPEDIHEDIMTWMHRKADRYYHDGDFDSALNCWRLIMILDPHFLEAYEVSWWLLWSLAVSAEQDGKKDEAEKYHARAVEVLERGMLYNPNVYDTYAEAGQYYMAIKHYDKARLYFARAAQFQEAPVTVKRSWAHACERAGDLKACIEVWQLVLKENPTDAVALTNLRRVQAKITLER
ncbi:MAG: tetratricopeptide repeat protein [candidate division KSB1 bacterium]|nr:tetratricopeptide repeat protein [candidate division KSB1 bacterium]